MGKSNSGEMQFFDVFWDEYPRKRAKIDAQRAWRKLNPSEVEAFAIVLGVQAYMRCGEWKEQKFIPYPATFLRRRQWEDDVWEPEQKTPEPRYCATCGHTGSWHLNETKHNRPPNHEFASDTENVAQPSGAIADGRI